MKTRFFDPFILVVYNDPGSPQKGHEQDFISEKAVEDQVHAVVKALVNLGYRFQVLAFGDILADASDIQRLAPDVMINLCEGYRGNAHHEQHVAGLWEMLNLAYTGNSAKTLALAQDKVLSKQVFLSCGIPTPDFQVFDTPDAELHLNFPLIAKPACEDASLGICGNAVIRSHQDLLQRVYLLLELYRQPVLVERYIPGREFNISIMGYDDPQILTIAEIDFSRIDPGDDAITNYEAKWLPGHRSYRQTPVICPANLDHMLSTRLCEISLRAYTCLQGRDYGRIDIRVDPQGRPFVLEMNPNPDISQDAGFSRALNAAGYAYEDFIDIIIQQAYDRVFYGQNQKNATGRSGTGV